MDDVGVSLSDDGLILVQAKRGLRRLDLRTADLRAAVGQLVAAMRHGLKLQSGIRPIDPFRDRLVIATDHQSSRSFGVLGTVCARFTDHPSILPLEAAAVSDEERAALHTFLALVTASWKDSAGTVPTPEELKMLLRVTEVARFDFARHSGTHLRRSEVMVADAPAMQPFSLLVRIGLEAARTRTWRLRHTLRKELGYVEGSSSKLGGKTPFFAVPPLMGGEVARPSLMQRLHDAVVSVDTDPNAIITGLRGSGGFGKSTLARIFAHHEGIRERFADGILWVSLGDDVHGPSLAGKVNDAVYLLTGERPPLTDPLLAGAELGRALDGRHLLLIVDDVWSSSQLEPFLHGGTEAVRLITTRQESILPPTAPVVAVEAMLPDEACEVLFEGLGSVSARTVTDVLAICGRWPMLLALINGAVRADMRGGGSADHSLQDVHEQIRRHGPGVLDIADESQRHLAVAATMKVSLSRLSPEEQQRYLDLAVFPEDADIPRSVLENYWHHTGGWAVYQTHRFCQRLTDLALAVDYRQSPARLRLHDVIRAWLYHQQKTRIPELCQALVDAHRHVVPLNEGVTEWWRLSLGETYLWSWLPFFLHGARLDGELQSCLHNPEYLIGKLNAVGPAGLEEDLNLSADPTTLALRQVVRQNAHVLGPLAPVGSLVATLASRLPDRLELAEVRRRLAACLTQPYIFPIAPMPDLPHPRLARVLAGHSGFITSLFVIGEDTIFSVGSDDKARVWDVREGQLLADVSAPEGKHFPVREIAVKTEVWHAYLGNEDQVLVVDPQTSKVRHRLIGHTSIVHALEGPADGSWLSVGDHSGTVRIWNPRDGSLTHTLEGHEDPVVALTASPDGDWLASASRDGIIRIWDPHTGNLLHTLAGHEEMVDSLARSPQGAWLASASIDGVIRIWDPQSGACLQTLEGHGPGFGAAKPLVPNRDGTRLFSSGFDGTIRIWDLRKGTALDVLTGHSGWAGELTISLDERWMASGGYDGKIYIWENDQNFPPQRLIGHSGRIGDLISAANGRWVASTGDDGDVRIWDPGTGRCLHVLRGHRGWAGPIVAAPDSSWLATTGQDGTVRVWDASTGAALHVLTGNSKKSESLAVSPDGRWLASSCLDGAVRIWDPHTGKLMNELEGGYGPLAVAKDDNGTLLALAQELVGIRLWSMPDGTTISITDSKAGDTGTMAFLAAPGGTWLANAISDEIQVWNTTTRSLTHTFAVKNGDEAWPCSLATDLSGTRLAASFNDGSIRVWDIRTGLLDQVLIGHSQEVSGLIMHPDGSWVASAGYDGTVRVWPRGSGNPIAALRTDDQLRRLILCGDVLVVAGSRSPYFFSFRPSE
ncbi:NB-ARC domain-containing protein [Acrocarpospora pleiomorpha]|nr:NB-ARC domain-containing protein [Acrocarpospora pleiomorpha]